jgi:tape measure domain-containing protein
MNVAALQVQIETTQAQANVTALDAKIRGIGATLTQIETIAQRVMRSLNSAFQSPQANLGSFNTTINNTTNNLTVLNRTSATTINNLNNYAGAARNASSGLQSLQNRLLGLAAGYLSLRGAMEGGNALVDARIEWERLDLGLKAVTGSASKAAEGEAYLIQATNEMGLSLEKTIPQYVKINAAFSQSGFSALQAKGIFEDVSAVTKTLGFDTSVTNRILYDFQEMASLGTVQLRLLRQVIMQIPGGLDIAARAMGVTTTQFHEMVHAGQLMAQDFIPAFTAELKNTFGKNLDEAADNMESNVNRLSNAWFLLKKNIAEGSLGNAIKGGLEGASALLNEQATNAEGQRLFNSIGGKYSSVDTQFSTLTSKFPKGGFPAVDSVRKLGNSPFAPPTYEPGIPDFLAEYSRMKRNQQDAETLEGQYLKSHPLLGPNMPTPERDISEHQSEAIQKIAELQEKAQIERLTGLQKEEAQIDLNADKQMASLVKLMKLFDSDKDKDKLAAIFGNGDPFTAITDGKNQAKANAQLKFADAADAKDAQTLVGAYKEFDSIQRRINESMGGNRYEQNLQRVNDQYDRMKTELAALSEFVDIPEQIFGDLEKARKSDLLNLKPKQFFDGTGIGASGLQGLGDDQKRNLYGMPVVDEETERAFQTGADRLAQIHTEMIRRMKANQMDWKDSMITGFKEVTDSWGTTSEKMATIGAGLATSLDTNLTDGLTKAIFETKNVGAAFTAMSQSIMTDLVRVAIQELIVRQAISGLSSGLGGLFGGGYSGQGMTPSMSAAGEAKLVGHSGAVIGGHADRRSFYRAPRFHDGGIVGDEMPMVARKGEVYFTPEQMNALGKAMGGGRTQQKVEVVNVFDDRMIEERLAANPAAILNVISRNANAVKRMVN